MRRHRQHARLPALPRQPHLLAPHHHRLEGLEKRPARTLRAVCQNHVHTLTEGHAMPPTMPRGLDTRPRFDDTGVRHGPNMTGVRYVRPDQKWTPCRVHLFRTLSSVAPQYRNQATWHIPIDLWEAIKKDPELNADWLESAGRNAENGVHRSMLGQPVHLVTHGPANTIQLVVDVDCRPSGR